MPATLKKIIHIEDEADIQAVARLALETVGGFALKTCSSGAEGIAAIVDFNPDLILLDVMMPEMDGPATLLEIRKIPGFEQTPAIFMTAKIEQQEIDELLQHKVVGVVKKPFDPMKLASEIKDIWSDLD